MRVFLFRVISILVVALVGIGCGYVIGYKRGQQRGDRDARDLVKMDLHDALILDRLQKDGDTNDMERLIRKLILAHTYQYDYAFSNETATDQWFINDLAAGHALEQQNH